MKVDFSRSTPLLRSARAAQIEGMFGMEPATSIERQWSLELDLEERPWTIGLVVGPSGSGKTTLLEEVFEAGIAPHGWPAHQAVIDAFGDDEQVETDEIVRTLTGVGFSSPPAWLRPYDTLSTGEQFRADLARTLLWSRRSGSVAVVDEFTSTVDRTVAKTASVAVARLLRADRDRTADLQRAIDRGGGRVGTERLVAASCHYDIIDWLQPDWLLDMAAGTFTWRSLQRRPPIHLELRRATPDEWTPFAPHHYLNPAVSSRAWCVIGEVEGRPATFCAVLPTPSQKGYVVARGSRTVCLPDFQGVGLGHATSDKVAACYKARGWRYRSVTGHPAMIGHRARSPLWDMVRSPSFAVPSRRFTSGNNAMRRTATFEYVGPAATDEEAEVLGVPHFTRKGTRP